MGVQRWVSLGWYHGGGVPEGVSLGWYHGECVPDGVSLGWYHGGCVPGVFLGCTMVGVYLPVCPSTLPWWYPHHSVYTPVYRPGYTILPHPCADHAGLLTTVGCGGPWGSVWEKLMGEASSPRSGPQECDSFSASLRRVACSLLHKVMKDWMSQGTFPLYYLRRRSSAQSGVPIRPSDRWKNDAQRGVPFYTVLSRKCTSLGPGPTFAHPINNCYSLSPGGDSRALTRDVQNGKSGF